VTCRVNTGVNGWTFGSARNGDFRGKGGHFTGNKKKRGADLAARGQGDKSFGGRTWPKKSGGYYLRNRQKKVRQKHRGL